LYASLVAPTVWKHTVGATRIGGICPDKVSQNTTLLL